MAGEDDDRRRHRPLTPEYVLATKRDNLRQHTLEELRYFVGSYAKDTDGGRGASGDGEDDGEGEAVVVRDYHMSAWLMAVCINGMTAGETSDLTRVMMETGETLDFSDVRRATGGRGDASASGAGRMRPIVGKHSTGGVGDKVTLILAPLVASLGILVPHLAGRGLGHTGGTIDKLESVPGFDPHPSSERLREILGEVGCAVVSPGGTIAPADKKMYALRDVTSTVRSIPLQTSSIMSKKLAEGPDSLVLDVKFGRGAFQETPEAAIELAESLISVGESHGKPTSALVTSMDDQPLGRAVGNWLEVLECVHTLRGCRRCGYDDEDGGGGGGGDGIVPPQPSGDLVDLCVALAARMLLQGGLVPSGTMVDGAAMAREALRDGRAWEKFVQMMEAQGGDVGCLTDPGGYPPAKFTRDVVATDSGTVTSIDPMEIGLTAVTLGAGRTHAGQSVDARAGIWLHVKVGDVVSAGKTLATVHSERGGATLEAAVERVGGAYRIEGGAGGGGAAVVEPPRLISHLVTKDGAVEFDMSVLG